MPTVSASTESESIKNEILDLERRLNDAKDRLKAQCQADSVMSGPERLMASGGNVALKSFSVKYKTYNA